MDELTVGDRTYTITRATAGDLPELIMLLRDDPLGAKRELSDPTAYQGALAAIDRDPNQYLACVRDHDRQIAATMQLTLIPGLSRGGAWRLQIEAVRVAAHARGDGLGTALMEWAHDFGRQHGATIAQLTSDVTREDAHRFYQRLGYQPSHLGFKIAL